MLTTKVAIDASGIDAVLSEAKKRNITLKGAKAAGKVLKVAARGQAPKRSGATKRAQDVKAAKSKKGGTISYAVQGVRRKFSVTFTPKGRRKPERVVPEKIDHLIQLGTRAHSLSKGARLARTRKGVTTAETGQDTGKKHPGAKPNPYRQRAWESVKGVAMDAAMNAMAQATQKEIDRLAAKIAAKAKKAWAAAVS
jgi:hypothetical protein